VLFVLITIRGQTIQGVSARGTSAGEQRIAKSMKKALPKFRSEDSELKFWESHDSVDFIEWRKARRVTLPNLKPSSKTISLRLPKPMLDRLKLLANKRDVPYQSLLKMFLTDRLKGELKE